MLTEGPNFYLLERRITDVLFQCDKYIFVLHTLSHKCSNILVVQSDTFHQSLLIACCAGAGSVLSTVYDAGLQSLETERVRAFLTSCRSTYSSLNPLLVHLGGTPGVVNAMGAGAGTMVQTTTFDKKVCQNKFTIFRGSYSISFFSKNSP